MSPVTELVSRTRRGLARRARGWEIKTRRRFPRFPDRVECPVCGWTGPQFAPSIRPRRPNRICPQCHSSERYRALELLMRSQGPVGPGRRLLEVAPVRTVERTARELGYEYTSIDLSSPIAQVNADLCRLPFPDGCFHTVVCFHVLEHIPADVLAVSELARIVGPGGRAIVVVPREDDRDETFEVPGADPADYERLYGQSDHVRIYGGDILSRWDVPDVQVVEEEWAEIFSPEVWRRGALAGDDDRFWTLSAPTT